MAGITTGIQLQDNFSSVLYDVCGAVNLAISSMTDMQGVMASGVDMSSLDGARAQIHSATAALNEMNEAIRRSQGQIPSPQVQVPETPQWQTDSLTAFTGSGMGRFRQEAQSANAMMQQLSSAQDRIARQALHTDILPPGASQDISSLAVRIDSLRGRIQAISENRVNMGTEQANAGLEHLRSQLDGALRQQENLNRAMGSGDISAVNSAYQQLSRTVSGTERYIRDNTNAQGMFNQQVREGAFASNGLMNAVKRVAAAYISAQGLRGALNLSDELTQTTARLGMMGKAFGEAGVDGQGLMEKVYLSAQDARGSLSGMSAVVARFGNNARDAFGSTDEVIDFANLVQKQMAIAGTSTQEAANAQLQLSQALGSGVLRGDELNSIFEQAPNLIQNIADYVGEPIGKIREMASEGEITADIVKAAVFSASDEINAKFSQMPMTWGELWQTFQNSATMAFQPVLARMNEMANSQQFQAFVENAVCLVAFLAGVVLNIFDLMGAAAGFIADNWSVIAPIIGGVVAALAMYVTVATIVAIVNGICATAEATRAATQALATGATFAETAAQHGLNAALIACPITWIILGIIALIAVVIAVANRIAQMSEVADSGFSVITGGINVVIQFFKNLGLTVANIALGIVAAVGALATNIKAAFHNALSAVKSWWYGLLSDAMFVIEKICSALNQLPFVEFDYSGITAAANDYAAKSAAAAGDKWEYTSVSDAFNEAASKYDTFKDGWASDAYNQGAEWGNGAADKLKDMFNKGKGSDDQGQYENGTYDYSGTGTGIGAGAGGPAADAANTAANTGQTAANTAAIADSLDISNEQLKYLRDIAERETVNRFTTASIRVEMTNHNNVSSGMDIDGIVDSLTSKVGNAMAKMAEGVHI